MAHCLQLPCKCHPRLFMTLLIQKKRMNKIRTVSSCQLTAVENSDVYDEWIKLFFHHLHAWWCLPMMSEVIIFRKLNTKCVHTFKMRTERKQRLVCTRMCLFRHTLRYNNPKVVVLRYIPLIGVHQYNNLRTLCWFCDRAAMNMLKLLIFSSEKQMY